MRKNKRNVLVIVLAVIALLGAGRKLTEDGQRLAEGVDPSQIIDVLPRDAITAIDSPNFESVADANKWLKDEDIVFGLLSKNVAKAYPQRILNWHEIVNDPDEISVTFCPLCGSALAFKSFVVVDGTQKRTTFGVSGKLYNSDLVMYDRETETLWSQITGEAIQGKLVDQKLEKVSIQTTTWKKWKELYPASRVLSRETGQRRNYDLYPYGNYESSQDVNFPVSGGVDTTIHPKAVVYGVEIEGKFKAYPENELREIQGKRIMDKIDDLGVEFIYDGVKFTIKRLDSGEELVPVRNFWFAWKAFHPDTDLYLK